ncbi:VCBS repeat-containing protein [Patescibacteria group bacterium]|nr:VCBS repeat-containing protein [Patescibacteria group bacterium]
MSNFKKNLIIILSLIFIFTNTGLIYATEETTNEDNNATEETTEEATDQPPADQGEYGSLDEGGDGEPYQAEQTSLNNFKKEAGLTGSLRVDNFTGAAVYHYGLEVPAGRNNFSPQIALSYNSHDQSQGSWAGIGWSMNVDFIGRSANYGTDRLYTEGDFVLYLNGKSYDLVLLDGEQNLYGAETENDYLKINYDEQEKSWTVVDTLGTKYYFGSDVDSRQDDPNDADKIYKWFLEEAVDTNDNFYRFEYLNDQEQLYPSKIVYTGYQTADGPMETLFTYEERDDDLISYQSHFPVVTAKRLSGVEIKVNSETKYRYELGYTAGQSDQQSMLQSITKKGYKSGQEYTLPATNFTYQQRTIGWTDDIANWPEIPYLGVENPEEPSIAPLVDYNSDSWTDIANLFHTGSNWVDNNWNFPPYQDIFEHSSIGDINGDKYPDVITTTTNPPYVGRLYLNNKIDGFYYSGSWNEDLSNIIIGPNNGNSEFNFEPITIVDINGDGLNDLIYAYELDNGQQYTREIYLNTGSGFELGYGTFPGVLASCDSSPSRCQTSNVQIVDVNNDGLVDIFNPTGFDPNYPVGIYLNTGSSWEQTPDSQWIIPEATNWHSAWIWGGSRLTDINGDSLIDIVVAARAYYLEGGSWDNHEYFATYLNNGVGWIQNDNWNLPTAVGYNRWDIGCRLFDVDNDGLMDVVVSYCTNYDWTGCHGEEKHVYMGTQIEANLLSEIDNGYGAVTLIEYQSSARYFDEQGGFKNPKLPLSLATVKQITVSDGLGNEEVTTYEYQDGAYYYNYADYTENQFAGFGQVTAITGDQVIKTYYHQGGGIDNYELGEFEDNIYKKGKIYREEVYQQDGEILHLLSQKINTWKNEDLGDGRQFIYLDSSVNYDFEEGQQQMSFNNPEPDPAVLQNNLTDLLQTQTFIPTNKPQLISKSLDGWSKIYYLGKNMEGQYLFRLEVFSGVNSRGLDENETGEDEFQTNQTGDGYIAYETNWLNPNETWGDVVDAQTGTSIDSSLMSTYLYIKPYAPYQGWEASRVFLPFDTSNLPEDITITRVNLQITVNNALNIGNAYIVNSNQNIPNLQIGDYGTISDQSAGSIYVDDTGTRDVDLNEIGRSWVNTNNWTKLALRSWWDFENHAPSSQQNNNYSYIYTAEADSSIRPILSVEYYYNNINPGIPTDLLVEGQINPDDVDDQNPEFSAIFHDENPEDKATTYQIQIIQENGDYNNPFWDSGQQALSVPVSIDQRSEDIEYTGPQLPLVGYKYFWRIKFWDDGDPLHSEGLWSSGQDYFYMDGSAAPSAPTGLLTEGRVNPLDIVNQNPSFTAFYNDPNPIDSAKWYQVQVDDNLDFSSPIWDSNKTLLNNLVDNGARSEEIVYNGSQLIYNGVIYYWRIKFWDNEEPDGTEGVWSETAQFTMFDDSNFLTNTESKAIKYHYNSINGNLIQEDDLGKVNAANNGVYVDITGDEKVNTYEYAENTEKHILSAAKRKIVTDQVTQEDTLVDLYYDDLPYGQIDKVNVTKENLDQTQAEYLSDYNDYGLVISKTDPLNHQAIITYDTYNYYPAETTNALNQTIQTEYDLTTGQVTKTEDPNGLIKERDYDAFGRLIEVRKSDPQSPTELITLETYEYHDDVLPSWIKQSVRVDENNWLDTYTYFDGLAREIQTCSQSNSNQYIVISKQYDNQGRLYRQSFPYFASGSSYSSPDWNSPSTLPFTEYTYDSLAKVLTEIAKAGQDYLTTYEYSGWDILITDPNSNQKKLYRDASGNLVQVDEYLEGQIYPTNYEYNYQNKLTRITDSQGNWREFEYDSLGRLIRQTEMAKPGAGADEWHYEYDDASNLSLKIDPNANEIYYTYDELNRMLSEDYLQQGGVETEYVYDQGDYGIGRLTYINHQNGETVYEYDPWGRIATEYKDILGTDFITSYTYTWQNQPLTVIYPDDFTVRYEYTNQGDLDKLYWQKPGEQEQEIISTIAYSPLKQVAGIGYANGLETVNTYDPAQAYRLTHKYSDISGNYIQDLYYSYDAVGNITQIIDTADTELKKTVNYTYDDLYRLTQADIINDYIQEQIVMEYEYDPIGNLTYKSDQGNYSYENNNPYQVNKIGDLEYFYDANGNLTDVSDPYDQVEEGGISEKSADPNNSGDSTGYDDGENNGDDLLGDFPKSDLHVKQLSYDYQDRLVSATINGETSNYYYDHSKNRVAKETPNNLKFYPNQYFELLDGEDGTKYVFLGNQRLAVINNEDVYFNFSDHLNSSSVTTDDQGNITSLTDYLPYGTDRININNSSLQNNYKFTDQEEDTESDLYYYTARQYDAEVGKFIQVDQLSQYLSDDKVLSEKFASSIEKILANPQQLNVYAYALNNPVIYNDPTGNEGTLWDNIKARAKTIVQNVGNILPLAVESYNAYQSRKSAGSLDRYLSLPSEEKAQYPSFDNFQIGEMNKDMATNMMMGAMGGGVSKLDNILNNALAKGDKTITLYRGIMNPEDYSKILKNGFSRDVYVTTDFSEALAYAKRVFLDNDSVVKMSVPIKTFAKMLGKGLLKPGSFGEEMNVISEGVKILNKFIN